MKALDEHLDPEAPIPDDVQTVQQRQPGTGRRMLRIAVVIAIGLAVGFFFVHRQTHSFNNDNNPIFKFFCHQLYAT